MDPLSMTASIIAVLQLTESLMGYLNAVTNASADQRKIATEAASLYSLLTTLRFRVEAARSDDPWYQQVRKLGNENEALDQFKSSLESIATRIQPGTGVVKAIKVVTWKFERAKVGEALKKIERLKTLVSLALQDDLLELSKEIHDDLGRLTSTVSKIADDERKAKFDRWLDVPDPSTNHNDACKKRQPTTGSWFLGSEGFSSWKSDPHSFLWLHGIPGCGKTVLCSTIIQNVEQHCLENLKSSYAYFYFDFNDEAKRRHDKFVRSLVLQLAYQDPGGLSRLEQLYSNCKDGQNQPTDGALVDILAKLLDSQSHIYIILDALDECHPRDDVLLLIQNVLDWHSEHLHLLVTSRRERDIEDTLESLATDNICIQNAAVDSDIQIHVRERLEHDQKLKKWPLTVQREIEQALTEGANGMFRWVVCQLDSIRKCIRLDGLRKTLCALPKTLEGTYTRILLSIEEEHRSDAQRVLQWLCFSARPLHINEIVEVLAIDLTENQGFKSEQRPPDPWDVVSICSSLVSTATTSNADPGQGHATTEIRLAHFSVKEYLTSDRIPITVLSHFNIRAELTHASMAHACLLYTLHLCSTNPLTSAILEEHPLAGYAADYWPYHVTFDGGSHKSKEIDELVLDLLDSSSKKLSIWLQLFNPDIPRWAMAFKIKIAPSLYYSSLMGIVRITSAILEAGADVNAQGGRFGTALGAAADGGHEMVVERLKKRMQRSE